ncbi:MAG: hypothetical protein WCO84_04625 [bacterium]
MPHRYDKKSRGTHTTCIDLTARIHDIAKKVKDIIGISLGTIHCGKGFTGGIQKVKIGEMKGGILLTVRQSRSIQEVRVFCADVQIARLALARALRDENIAIEF